MIEIRQGSIEEIVALSQKIPELKNPYGLEDYKRKFNTKHIILVATAENQIVGFKCGYERDPDTKKFYSWMGGVLPEFRKSGAAKLLLHHMEKWCLDEGYQILEFKTLNEHKAMLIFSLKYGFEIIDVVNSDKDLRKRIVLQKKLNP